MTGRREALAEFLGTALLLTCGLSAIVLDFSPGSPVAALVPDEWLRRLLTSLLFSASATAVVYSPIGRVSGGHINPAVTLAFFRLGKLTPGSAGAYVLAQLCGAAAGTAVVLLAWGHRAAEVRLGATVPGRAGTWPALGVETAATFLFVALVLAFTSRPGIAHLTAAAAGLFGMFLTFFAFPVSGAGLNPARSFGPALVGDVWTVLWIYFAGPLLGSLAASALFRDRVVPCGKLIHDPGYRCRFKNCLYDRNAGAGPPAQPGEPSPVRRGRTAAARARLIRRPGGGGGGWPR
ncbi:aquaporin [Streptacidiphilus sp. ASG 303]|uniref:MIP/aquaporin family protein n=1 Tax=Streptacidiphilus sp. ASG 303 TaxID=2896847 RepID=UPI001E587E8D|nr:aquaporin [Streptacidiphilus sp. ASG 303]MCD0484117.1 aquaporin [Streptacidiphilus sp. ASG 303]